VRCAASEASNQTQKSRLRRTEPGWRRSASGRAIDMARAALFPLRATTTAAGPNAPRIARRCPGRTNEQTRFPSASEGGRRPQARSARAERAIRRCASNSKYVQSARCRRSWCGRNSCCRRQSIDRVLRTRRAGCRAVYLGHIERVDGLAGERTDVGRSDR
jgi:hypothetical protein